jgi:Family of unknown function (DUF5758)/Pentapeptide repeats (8 copies)
MNKDELKLILDNHKAWLLDNSKGAKANLFRANLYGTDLSEVNLSEADLSEVNLYEVNLYGANLYGTDLFRANLSEANLSRANLSRANLSRANLFRANLSRANLFDTILPNFSIVPEEGGFIAFKKLSDGVICKLWISSDAKRTSSLIGRKCRAEYVEVLEGEGYSPTRIEKKLYYKAGKIVRADAYDPDIRVECAGGIHFYLTRKEAQEH